MNSSSVSFFRRPLVLAVSVVLLAHAPMLICDTVLWDSAAVKYTQESGVNIGMRARGSQEGGRHVAEFHIAFGRLPYAWHLYRVVAYGCLAATTIGIYLVISAHSGLSENEAAAAAALSMLFPTFVLWQEPIMIFQALCTAAFWTAAAWRLRQLQHASDSPFAVAATVILFLLSFFNESLLVFFYVLLAYYFLIPSNLPWRSRAVDFFRRNWLFALLPFFFFFTKRIVSPVHSIYSNYNTIHFNNFPALFAKGVVVNAKRMLIDQGLDLVRFIREQPVFFLILACISFITAFVFSTRFFPSSAPRLSGRNAAIMLAFCLAAYFAAVFPYAVVNKFPFVSDFNARLAALIFLPIAAAYIIAIRSLTSRRRIAQVAYGVALGVLILLTLRDRVLWQNRYVKYLGILEQLRGSEDRLASTVIFKDEAPFGMSQTLLTYELNWIMYHAWHNLTHLGFDERRSTPVMIALWQGNEDQKATIYPDYKYDGRVSRVTILPGRPVGELEIYLRYFFSSSADRVDFLRSLVQLRIEPPKKLTEQ